MRGFQLIVSDECAETLDKLVATYGGTRSSNVERAIAAWAKTMLVDHEANQPKHELSSERIDKIRAFANNHYLDVRPNSLVSAQGSLYGSTSSKYRGVTMGSNTKKPWVAQVGVPASLIPRYGYRKQVYLGNYDDELVAARIAECARRELQRESKILEAELRANRNNP